MAVNQQQPMQEVHSQLKLCLTNWSQNASGTPKSRSATSGENLEKSSLESDIATSETAHSHGETVIKPSLRNYGGRPGHQFCSGCYNVSNLSFLLSCDELTADQRLYGAGYTCQECKDFYLCPLCMESELQPHFEHRFRSLVYGSVFLRKHVGTSNDDWNDMSKEDSVSSDREVTGGILETPEPPMMEGYACSPELTFLVKTRYKYVYLRSGGEKIGELESFTPRLPSRRKIVGRDIPVIEKIITIRTALPKEASLAEMQAVDFVPSPSDCHVSINSPMLLNALRAVVAYYPGWSLNEGSLVYCRYDSTICLLSHHRHQLLRYKHEHPSTHSEEYVRECNAHIDEVIRFLDLETDLAPKRLEDQMCGDDPTVTYDQLEMLFKPGLEIYAWNDDQLGAFIITSTIKDVRDSKSEEFLHIVAWNLDFDGTDLGRACRNIFIKKFKDQQKIRCLPCFPTSLKFETWGGKPTRQRLIERGQKFFELCKGPNYMEVTGFTRDLPKRKVKWTCMQITPIYGRAKSVSTPRLA
ncbi:MAG: hypothetical protein M1820_008933 [Bogoriella megaspora]|nr:MAG: hypothetical protein M1820_008933 [Bogoriella megaspora]